MAFSTHDIVPESPTNNFCTLNLLDPTPGSPNLEDGSLTFTAGLGYVHANGTFFLESGKWYFEFHPITELNSSNKLAMIGFREKTNINEFYYRNDGLMFDGTNSTGNSTYNTSTARDVIGCYLNLDDNNGEITFYKNGSVENGAPFASNILANLTTKAFVPFIIGYSTTLYANFGQDPSFGGNKNTPATVNGVTGPFAPSGDAEGTAGLFYYPPPAGALALCTANLADPDIDPAVDDLPEDYMRPVVISGTNADNNNVFVGFQPDLCWLKNRNGASGHMIVDSVRGAGYALQSDNTGQEGTYNIANDFKEFTSTGFNLGAVSAYGSSNPSGTNNIIAWCFRAGGAPSGSNIYMKDNVGYQTLSAAGITAGTITPTAMSVNTKAGFSIVKYVSPNPAISNPSVPHGLDKAPDFVIIKRTSSACNWVVKHVGYNSNANNTLRLDTTDDIYVDAYNWGGNQVTNTVVPLGNYSNSDTNKPGETNIMYCWHSVAGYSAFGSYTGNGSATDGPFIYTGFKPAWVMIKNTSDSNSWMILDNQRSIHNLSHQAIRAESSGLEITNQETNYGTDLLSNGFKPKTSGAATVNSNNATGDTYIYAAFAEMPQKYANAR